MLNKLSTIKRNLVKDTCPKLGRDHKLVKELLVRERAFKREYGLQTKVLYIDVKYRDSIRPGVNGFYSSNLDEVVVFIDSTISAVRILETLYHELTHSYQNTHMNKRYVNSCKMYKAGKTNYKTSWHEIHAKEIARSLIS